MLLHCFFYVPTMSVTNAIAFANIKDAKDFGVIRLWGTVGWIAASWPLHLHSHRLGEGAVDRSSGRSHFLAGDGLGTLKTGPGMEAALATTFTVAGIASLVLAVSACFCRIRRHRRKAGSSFAPLDAFKLLAVPSILVLFIVTLFDSLVHYTYFFWASRYLSHIGMPENWISPSMCIGQFAEIPTMAGLGLVLKKLGWRTTMILGILGHVVRFGIYSIGSQ